MKTCTTIPAILLLAILPWVIPQNAVAQTDFWLPSPGPEGGRITGITRLSNGEILALGQTSGIFRSRDDGRTWMLVNGNIAGDYGSGGIWFGGIAADADQPFLLSGWGIWRGTPTMDDWTWTMLWSGPPGPVALDFLSTPSGRRLLSLSGQGWIWISDDQGDTWSAAPLPWFAPNQAEWGVGLAVGADGRIWAATTRAVYLSTDGGNAWARVALATDYQGAPWSWSPVNEFSGPVAVSPAGDVFIGLSYGDGTLRIRPDGSSTVVPTYELAYFPTSFAFGTDGAIYAGTYQNSGVLRSLDQGDSWHYLGTWNGQPGLASHSVWSVALLPDGTVLAGAAGDGILRCLPNSAAAEWTASKSGMIGSDVTAMAAAGDGSVYAAAAGAGLFRSDDLGQSWQRLAPERWVGDTVGARDMVVDSHGTLFVAWHGIAVSGDRGLSWTDRWVGNANAPDPGQTPAATALVVDRSDRMVVGTLRGVFLTPDGGLTWQTSNLELPIYSLSLGVDQRTMTATTWGEGPGHGLYISRDAGLTWASVPFFTGVFLLGSAVAADGTVFGAPGRPLSGEWNPGLWRSLDGGTTWQKLAGFDQVAYGLSGASSFATPQLLFNPDQHLYAALGGSGVVRTKDRGETWEVVDSGLGAIPVRSVLDLVFDTDGFAWAGTWGAGVFRSRESTAPFQNVEIALPDRGTAPRISLHASGQLKVVLWGNPDFDTAAVKLATVQLSGARILKTPSGKWLISWKDDNRDGRQDLVLHFSIPDLQLQPGATDVVLEGRLDSGRAFRARASVLVQP